MAKSGSSDREQTKPAPPMPEPVVPNTEPAATSPSLVEPPLDINTGIPDPLKSDLVPGDRPADMPPAEK